MEAMVSYQFMALFLFLKEIYKVFEEILIVLLYEISFFSQEFILVFFQEAYKS